MNHSKTGMKKQLEGYEMIAEGYRIIIPAMEKDGPDFVYLVKAKLKQTEKTIKGLQADIESPLFHE